VHQTVCVLYSSLSCICTLVWNPRDILRCWVMRVCQGSGSVVDSPHPCRRAMPGRLALMNAAASSAVVVAARLLSPSSCMVPASLHLAMH
jgi:hypothetical protein